MKEPQQRFGPTKKRELFHRAIEVSVTGGVADGFRIGSVELAAHCGIDVAQHGIMAEGPHARPIHGFNACLQTGFYHGFSRVPVRGTDALAKAIVERVVEIEDNAANEGLSRMLALAATM